MMINCPYCHATMLQHGDNTRVSWLCQNCGYNSPVLNVAEYSWLAVSVAIWLCVLKLDKVLQEASE
jgi:transposase-like protein